MLQKYKTVINVERQRRVAYPAYEAAGVPLSGQGRHVVLHYGTGASTAFGGEHVEVIVPAVRPALPLVESFLAELFAALGAEKVFGVPSLFQGRHAFLKTTIIPYNSWKKSAGIGISNHPPPLLLSTAIWDSSRGWFCTSAII